MFCFFPQLIFLFSNWCVGSTQSDVSQLENRRVFNGKVQTVFCNVLFLSVDVSSANLLFFILFSDIYLLL